MYSSVMVKTDFVIFLDHDAELKLAHLKIKDLENALQKQKDEVNSKCFMLD